MRPFAPSAFRKRAPARDSPPPPKTRLSLLCCRGHLALLSFCASFALRRLSATCEPLRATASCAAGAEKSARAPRRRRTNEYVRTTRRSAMSSAGEAHEDGAPAEPAEGARAAGRGTTATTVMTTTPRRSMLLQKNCRVGRVFVTEEAAPQGEYLLGVEATLPRREGHGHHLVHVRQHGLQQHAVLAQ